MEIGKVYTSGLFEFKWTGLGYVYKYKGCEGWKPVLHHHLEIINEIIVDTVEEGNY